MTRPHKELTQKILDECLYLDGGEWYWRIHQGRQADGSKAGSLRADGTCIVRIFSKGYTTERLKFLLEKGHFPKRCQRRIKTLVKE
jgi:hypothetical protein